MSLQPDLPKHAWWLCMCVSQRLPVTGCGQAVCRCDSLVFMINVKYFTSYIHRNITSHIIPTTPLRSTSLHTSHHSPPHYTTPLRSTPHSTTSLHTTPPDTTPHHTTPFHTPHYTPHHKTHKTKILICWLCDIINMCMMFYLFSLGCVRCWWVCTVSKSMWVSVPKCTW